jgi:hypothetical protein
MGELSKVIEKAWPGVLKERRVWLRYPCDKDGACQPILAGKMQWSARIQNISCGGIKVIVNRRFETQTLLQIDLEEPDVDSPRTLLARVVQITPEADGTWGIGCLFPRELTEADVRRFLDGPPE